MGTPRVFVSYSHDSDAHKAWVRRLSEVLRQNGIDVVLDQWDLTLGSDLPRFMESGLTSADRVIVICTEKYMAKANAGSGGAGYEKMIASAEMLRDQGTDKFVPVVRDSYGPALPIFLSSRLYIDFSDDQLFDGRCQQLLRELHRSPESPKPPLGRNPFASLPALNALGAIVVRIDQKGAVLDLTEDWVHYCDRLRDEGRTFALEPDVARGALVKAVPLHHVAYNAIDWSSDVTRLLADLRAMGATTAEQHRLYLALAEVEDGIRQLHLEMSAGWSALLTQDSVRRWVSAAGDVLCAIDGYTARCLPSSGCSYVTLWNDDAACKGKALLPEAEKEFFRRKGAGVWSDFHHDLLVSAVVPGIVFAVLHCPRLSPAASMDSLLDPRGWKWSDFHEEL